MAHRRCENPFQFLPSICTSEVVGDRAREIAGGLGEVLARTLERYSPPQASGATGSGTAVTGGTGGGTHTGAGHGMMTPYTVTLRYFDDREALTIIGVMADEFPGYETHDLINKSATVRRYEYLTTAKAMKLEEWLFILLRDMGFDETREILVQVQDTDITVDKLIPTPDRPESADEKKRFNQEHRRSTPRCRDGPCRAAPASPCAPRTGALPLLVGRQPATPIDVGRDCRRSGAGPRSSRGATAALQTHRRDLMMEIVHFECMISING